MTNATPDQSDYDERYFQTGLGLPYNESEPHWARFFGDVADHIVAQLAPRSVLDAGCAKGFLVAALARRGVDAVGVDVSEYAVAAAVEGAQGRLRIQSLTEDLGGRWDLVTCIEVLEHMTPSDTQLAIDRICATTDRVLLSSTPHDFVEPSHVNVRPVSTWVSWFAARGFFRRTDLDLSFLSPWALVFERRALTASDVAYFYEVEMAPLREEVAVKRAALLESERRVSGLIAELSTARELGADTDATDVEPRYDVDRVVSLIDQVIGLRAELAEERYHHELALEAAGANADNRLKELVANAQQAEDRASAAERRLAEILGSRSWRRQTVQLPVAFLRRTLRKKA
jgi:SAM-dependent methyltransferase